MTRWIFAVVLAFGVLLGLQGRAAAQAPPDVEPSSFTCPASGRSITGSILETDSVQNQKFIRAGNPISTCEAPKSAPPAREGVSFNFDVYRFRNRTLAPNPQCIEIRLDSTADLQSAVYVVDRTTAVGFDKSEITRNFVGDSGPGTTSTRNTITYFVQVPARQEFDVVVTESSGATGGTYTLIVKNCGDVSVERVTLPFGHSSGGLQVSVAGAGFLTGATVDFGGQLGTEVRVVNDDLLTVRTPAHAAGAVDVTVSVPAAGGAPAASGTLANGFTFYDDIPTAIALAKVPGGATVRGQEVTLTATVTVTPPAPNALGYPHGEVEFFDGATSLGKTTVQDVNPRSPFTVRASRTIRGEDLAVGNHSFTARFTQRPVPTPGAVVYLESVTASPTNHEVTRANTRTEVLSSQPEVAVNTRVTFTATVTPLAPGRGVIAGTEKVQFFDNGQPLGPPQNVVNGRATFTTQYPLVGTHVITASYSGDDNFNPSTSAPVTQTVTATATQLTITANPPSRAVFGSDVTFTVTVSEGTGGQATGTVTFFDGVNRIGDAGVALVNGMASITTRSLAVGEHTINVTYSGDLTHTPVPNASLPGGYEITRAVTSVVLVSSINPSAPGQQVTFTASVTSPVSGVITGTVSFFDGGSLLGTTAVSGGDAFTATLSTSALAVGQHSIQAVYNGEGNFGDSAASNVVLQVVQAQVLDGGVDADAAPADAGTATDAGGGTDAGTGLDSGTTTDAGTPGTTDGGDGLDSGVVGPRADGGATTDAGTIIAGGGSDGCGCTTAGAPASGAAGGLLFAGLGALAARRRRRKAVHTAHGE